MDTRPITAAIQDTVDRLLQAEHEASACMTDLNSIGVTLRRTPEGVFWALPSASAVGVVAKSKDMTPVFYLVEKFLQQPDAKQNAALAQLPALMEQMAAVMKAAGVKV